MKILFYGESPLIPTGTGLLSRNIIRFMLEFGYDLEQVGINHFMGDSYDHELYPFKIHGAPVNEAYNLELAKQLIRQGEYDLLFLSADVGQINALAGAIEAMKLDRYRPVIMYSCVDCDDLNHQTLSGWTHADRIAVYSQHSKQIARRYIPALRVEIIEPGCEPDVFYPLPEEERQEARKKIFDIDDETFLVINVNRNQWRKDIGRSLMIFHEFHKKHKKSAIYLHMKLHDIGGDLPTMAGMLGMQLVGPGPEVYFTGSDFHEQRGVERAFLNVLYNSADCLMSTTTGEGWGLTTTDAMAAGCPVIVPRNSSALEIVGKHEERGYLVDSGGDVDHLIIPYGMSDNPRPIVHTKSMIEKLEYVHDHANEAREKAVLAREWTQKHTWSHAREHWRKLFAEMEAETKGGDGI